LEETQNNNFEPAEQTESQKEQNSLIDDFLNNFNKAPETIFLDEEKTEEEAIRLFEQGNTRAAIAIYEQLKLKHPEKAAYYQSQIDIFSMDFGSTNFTTTQELQETEQKAQETTTETTNIFSETNLDNIDTNFSNNLENQSTETSSEITESQAIAYFNEGNVAKAIEIYRQLMLQNPDKKAYFASQIEILES
jgi:tetratricopeptide (TPR) repeat protein